ncbi:type I restriction enzyme, S subunit [Salegentibacter agarivorans]|uniref:Type I restriction enzyme, S subunit n=1 Tax=Salegentibacter agarivorans TaxID=345907 RepID=A0A1I2KQR0_9FLAO|nr:restriction endonuclease subunit S [Salegentibacter agarivorans]SFF68863.1 type I restriction enzyme, S subunit [Salegentibacter agarivorans]
MNKKKDIVPKLRFPGFEENWKIESLSKVYDLKITNSFSRDKLNYKDGKVKNIHYGDIHTKFSTLFNITREDVPYINKDISIEKIDKANFCQEGDIVIADASEDIDDIGKSIEIVNINKEKVLAGLHTFLARRIDSNPVIGYGGYLFKSNAIREQIKREAQGAKVLGISKGRISNIKLCYPNSPKEQQKIANCLSSLDEVITTETEKLELLQDHKKGLLQQLFPQEGETQPKYRFPEFKNDGDWEIDTFSKFIKLYRGSSPRPINQFLTKDQDGVNWIKIGDTKKAKGFKISEVEEKITVLGSKKSRKVKKGELILANSMSYGATYELELEGCIYDGWFVLREFEDSYDRGFLIQLLNSNYLQNQYKQLAAGGIVQNISSEIVYATLLPIFSKKEQQKIAVCLSTVDKLIAAQTQKIEQLQDHKKGLLQQLFPSLNELAV